MSLLFAYITNIETFVLDYKGESHTLIKNVKTTFDLTKITGRTYFYNFGNETPRDKSLENQNFYQVRPDLFEFKVGFHFGLSKKSSIWAGTSFNNSMIKYDPNSLLDSLQLKNAEERSQLGIHVGYTLDTRDHQTVPMEGFYLDFNSLNYPKLLNKNDHYSKIIIDVRAYFSSDYITQSSLGLRATGEKVWGKFPLHMTPFLGGTNNLHGFERNRFAGNALVYTGSELRSYLFPLKILVPSKFGFSAFAETGRVFYPGEDSKKWHSSFGGGFWLVFLNRELTISLSLAQSTEDMILYLTTGFLF
jgi:outer membrane protein assembly factor BamA